MSFGANRPTPLPKVSVVCAVSRYMPDSWLQAIASQSHPDYDVSIVDADLRGDYDAAIARVITDPEQRARLRYVRLEAGGRAVAANYGIDHSDGEIVLFLGDDIIPEPGTVEAHARHHVEHPAANAVGIGTVELVPEFRSRFTSWLEGSGQTYGTRTDDVTDVPTDFFYIANASVKRCFLDRVGRFDERFPYHAWDDYEFGLRLAEAGMTSAVVAGGSGAHYHDFGLRDRRATMDQAGVSARIFEGLRPGPYSWTAVTDRPPWRHHVGAIAHLARFAIGRNEQELHRYYRRMLDASFSAGYRRPADRAPDRHVAVRS